MKQTNETDPVTTATKLKSTVYTAVFWPVLSAVAWLAVHGNSGCKNVLVLYVWFGAIILPLCILAVSFSPPKKKVSKESRSFVPKWVINALQTAELLFFVWYGWWFTTVGIAIALLSIYILRQLTVEPDKEVTA